MQDVSYIMVLLRGFIHKLIQLCGVTLRPAVLFVVVFLEGGALAINRRLLPKLFFLLCLDLRYS